MVEGLGLRAQGSGCVDQTSTVGVQLFAERSHHDVRPKFSKQANFVTNVEL